MTVGRLRYVDSMRGIAASMVVAHHLLHNTVLEVPLRGILPGFLLRAQGYGAKGVQVFFVLSGFVIVLSLAQTELTRRGAGLFAARRQLRLDPPYWATMAVALGAMGLEAAAGFRTAGAPSAGALIANALYLHEILNTQEIVGVAWTLCIEIQFYLVVIGLLAIPRVLRREPLVPDAQGRHVGPLLFVTGLGSLAFVAVTDAPTDAWFISFWFFFAAGGLASLAMLRLINWAWPSVFSGLMLAVLVARWGHIDQVGMIAGLVAMAVLAMAVHVPAFADALGKPRVLQYLGARSYSLYLVHLTALSLTMRVGYKVTGDSEPAAVAWMLVGAAASVIAAEALYRLVERPSVRLAARLKTEPPAAVLRSLLISLRRRGVAA